MAAKAIPEGYHTVTPYLVVRGAAKTMDFAKKAFGAELAFEPLKRPDGTIMHAELKIGDSHVMISDATEQHPPMPSMLLSLCPERRRRLPARGGRRRHLDDGADGSVLRRPQRRREGSRPAIIGSSARTRKMSRRRS